MIDKIVEVQILSSALEIAGFFKSRLLNRRPTLGRVVANWRHRPIYVDSALIVSQALFLRSIDKRIRESDGDATKKVRLEDTINLIESGPIDLPTGVDDIATFLISDGKKIGKTVVGDCRLDICLADLLSAIAGQLPCIDPHRKGHGGKSFGMVSIV